MSDDLANDLLWGAGRIAKELFGADNKKNRRRVYHLHTKKRLPTWKNGPDIITRKSMLNERFAGPKVSADAT